MPGAIRSLGMPRLTAGAVPFGAANGVAAQDAANLSFDDANNRLLAWVGDKGGQVYNALAYGVVGDGSTSDTTALNTLITTVNGAGGGEILLPPGRTYAFAATVTLKSDVRTKVGAGATLKWTGSAGGVMFATDGTNPCQRAGVIGETSKIDPNGATNGADILFDLHSPQFCEFGGFEVLGGRTTTTVVKIQSDATNATGYQSTRNAVLNRVHDLFASGTVGKGVYLSGTSGNYTTLNHFENLWFFDVRNTGIEFAQWSDNNTFAGNIDIQLAANNAVGVAFNTAAPTSFNGVYANHFDDLAVDAFGTTFTGRKSVVVNYATQLSVKRLHLNPPGEGGAIVWNGLGTGLAVEQAGRVNSFAVDVHETGVSRSPVGVVMDGQRVTDAAITSGTATLTSASGLFAYSDVGKPIVVQGAGASGATLVTTILAYTSATAVTLAANAGTTVTGAVATWGTDNAAALNAAITNAQTYGGQVDLAAGVCCFASTITLGQYVHLLTASGTTVRWLGAAGGTMFKTGTADVTLHAGLVGKRSTIDANNLADLIFDIHSAQFGEFGNFVVQNTRPTTVVISLQSDATSVTDGTQFRRNSAYNTFYPVWVPNSCDTILRLKGFDSNSPVTLNRFAGLFGQSVLGTAVRMVAWCDNNVFFDANDFQIDANNATGVTVNESAVGSVYQVPVTAPGSAYTSPPAVTFPGGGGSGLAGYVPFLSAGTVTQVLLTNNGTGYAQSGYLGTGGTLNLTTSGGAITSATVNAVGSGYPASTTIRLAVTGGGGTNGEVTITTNASGQLAGAVTISVAGTGYANTTGAATKNTPLVTFSGGAGSGAAATTYNGGPTVDVGVYANKFSHLAVDGFGSFTNRRGLVFAASKHNVVQNYHQDPAVEGGAIVNLGSALDWVVERTGIPGGVPAEFVYYNTNFTIGKSANDGVSRITIGGRGATDATYGWTHYNSAGQLISSMTDGGFLVVLRYSDSTGGAIAVVQNYLSAAINGAFIGHYAYKAYNTNVGLHTQALIGARFVNTLYTSMTSRLELGWMNAMAENGANNQPNTYAYLATEGFYGPMNVASGVTATPSISAAGAVPAFGLSTTGGCARVIAVLTPAAPSSATPSPTGATSFWWWLVAEDRNGFRTLPSASRTIANAPATLGGGNQVTVNFVNVAGAVKFYVLRTTSSTAPTGTVSVLAGTVAVPPGSADNAALAFIDTTAAGSLASFTVPARNTTADLTVDGNATVGAMASAVSGCAFTATASASSTTTAETKSLIGTGVGSNTVPANYATAGKKVVLRAKGVITTGATAGTVTFQVKLGSTVVASTGAVAPTISQTNKYWEMECEITFRTIGTSGTVIVQGRVSLMNAATPAAMVTWPVRGNSADPPATVTIDTTASQAIDFQSITSNALHTITCNAFDTCPVS